MRASWLGLFFAASGVTACSLYQVVRPSLYPTPYQPQQPGLGGRMVKGAQ